MKLFVGSARLACSTALMLAAAQPISTIDVEDFAAEELYLYSKGDGIIRKVIGATGF